MNVPTMVKKLREGIAQHRGLPRLGDGSFGIGVWMMEPGEDAIVGERIRAILAGK